MSGQCCAQSVHHISLAYLHASNSNCSFYLSRFSEVFFVDATTVDTITADLRSIAIDKGVGDSEKDWKDALNLLSNERKEWLLLFNNADDTRLNLRNYFPSCYHGNILITSRNHDICQHATGRLSNCKVSGLTEADARCLLLEISGLTDEEHADETERLASAIVKVRTISTCLV